MYQNFAPSQVLRKTLTLTVFLCFSHYNVSNSTFIWAISPEIYMCKEKIGAMVLKRLNYSFRLWINCNFRSWGHEVETLQILFWQNVKHWTFMPIYSYSNCCNCKITLTGNWTDWIEDLLTRLAFEDLCKSLDFLIIYCIWGLLNIIYMTLFSLILISNCF